MSKKIVLLCMATLLAVVGLFAGCGNGADSAKSGEKVLKVGTSGDFAPISFQSADGKSYEGFDIDIIRAVGEEMGYKVEISNVNFDGLFPALEVGNIDVAISGITINDERKGKAIFSDPYYKSGLTVVVAKDNGEINGINDLSGKQIAVQVGTTGAKEVRKLNNVKVVDLENSSYTFIELGANSVDAVVNDRPVNDFYIKQNGEINVRVLSEQLTNEEYGIAFSKKNTELQAKVNVALKKIHENGKYDKIFEKWFGSSSR